MTTRVHVGGLAWATTEDSLRERFGEFGEVTYATVVHDRETGRSKGFGFVEFSESTSAEKAIEGMAGKDLDGRSVRVEAANPRQGGPPRRDFGDRGGYERRDRGGDRGGYDRGGDRGGYERRDRGSDRGGLDRRDRGDDRGGYDRRDREERDSGNRDRSYGSRDQGDRDRSYGSRRDGDKHASSSDDKRGSSYERKSEKPPAPRDD